jgi:hypothetical protein
LSNVPAWVIPPKNSKRASASSYVAATRLSAGGAAPPRNSWVQPTGPSFQVSFSAVVPFWPPNKIARAYAES